MRYFKTSFTCLIMFIAVLFIPNPIYSREIDDFSIEWVDSSEFPVNIIYYSTSGPEGGPAGSMWVPDHVRIWEDGVEHIPGKFEDGEHAPAYLSIVIDSSGSMEGSMREVLDAAGELIKMLDGQDRAEIVDFDSSVITRSSFTGRKDRMLGALNEVVVGGGTALFDAVGSSFDSLKNRAGMKAVVVLSDGEDENSTRYTFETLKPRLTNEGVRVFTIALGKNVDTDTMNAIAGLSGGGFYQAEEAGEVGKIYTEIIT